MDRLSIVITSEFSGLRVDKVLHKAGFCADSYISSLKFIKDGIWLNGKPVRTSVIVKEGDMLSFSIQDVNPGNEAEPMPYPLDFVYEDDYLACLNKPVDMVVHGSLQGGKCTVANVAAWKWGNNCSFHPVNRLDRDTSGLMMIAKSGYIHDRLRNMLHTGNFQRWYLAIVEGELSGTDGVIELPLVKGDNYKVSINKEGMQSRTEYSILSKSNGYTFLRIKLFTGRMHQIRAHFSAIGYPLAGDLKYGGRQDIFSRPALHSFEISFQHPATGKQLNLKAPVPADLESLIRKLHL